jgi:hypothetical protein
LIGGKRGVKPHEYFIVMLFMFCTGQMQHNPNSVERNVLCGINDAREVAVGGIVIVLNGGSKMQVTSVKHVWMNEKTHEIHLIPSILIYALQCV